MSNSIKERPILFKGQMVLAILDGSKTQTRRIMKPQPPADAIMRMCDATDPVKGWQIPGPSEWWENEVDDQRFKCPQGKLGDRLWVRETWRCRGGREYEYQKHQPSIVYRASTYLADDLCGQWRPSIFMPRWASRLTLGVTKIRVERLSDISEEDARAEGVDPCRLVEMKDGSPCYSIPYRILWEAINGTGSWDKNPWVWVVEFRKLP